MRSPSLCGVAPVLVGGGRAGHHIFGNDSVGERSIQSSDLEPSASGFGQYASVKKRWFDDASRLVCTITEILVTDGERPRLK